MPGFKAAAGPLRPCPSAARALRCPRPPPTESPLTLEPSEPKRSSHAPACGSPRLVQ